MLRAGRLRHRVSLQRLTQVQDPDTGAMIEGWEEYAKVWASVEPLSAREFIAAQATQSKVSARILIRHRSDVIASDRVVHNGKPYNIEGVLPDADSGLEYVTLPVSSGVREG